jgi:flagellar biogenesis protein FliO
MTKLSPDFPYFSGSISLALIARRPVRRCGLVRVQNVSLLVAETVQVVDDLLACPLSAVLTESTSNVSESFGRRP